MNKKGFTIIEVLSVIAIVAVTGTVGIISYNYLIKSSEEKEYETYISAIEKAACTYASVEDLRDNCNDPNNCELIVNKTIIYEEGYLDKKYLNSITEEKIATEDIIVKWDAEGNKTCIYEEKDK